MSDPYKLRAMGVLVAAGFLGGLFAQYQGPGQFVPPPRHAKTKKHRIVAEGSMEEDEQGDPIVIPMGAPVDAAEAKKEADEKAAAEAKRKAELELHTPAIQSKYAAIAAILDNTIKVTKPGGVVTHYFSSRGISAEIDGDLATMRIWRREDDRLCQQVDADQKECFSLVVNLEKSLQKGPASELRKRIGGMAIGARIGVVSGMGGAAELVRGNVANFPEYVPLLDPNPDRLGPQKDPLPGALLIHSGDGESAATYFSPGGRLIVATRLKGTSDIVKMWTGNWRMSGAIVCRDLQAAAGGNREECSHMNVSGRTFAFPDADPSRRSYQRIQGDVEARRAADKEAAEAEAKEAAAELERERAEARAQQREQAEQRESATLTLAPSADSGALNLARPSNSSYSDLR